MKKFTKNEIKVFSFLLGSYTFWNIVIILTANILL